MSDPHRIFVTGGTGNVGSVVVRRLVAEGCRLTLLDPAGGDHADADAVIAATLDDVPTLTRAMAGHDAVLHLAAVAGPFLALPREVFRVNGGGTFNVFQAAVDAGVGCVVQASSINTLGLFFGLVDVPPAYFPVDEQHPPFATDAYSFSKDVAEQVGKYFWQREQLPSVALRLPWITRGGPDFAAMRERQRALVEQALRLDPIERRAWCARHVEAFTAYRAARHFETRTGFEQAWADNPPMPMASRDFVNGRNNLWAALHEDDCADAFARALAADFNEASVAFVADDRNWLGVDSEPLVGLCFPHATRRRTLRGDEALVCLDAARRLIDFQTQHHLADA